MTSSAPPLKHLLLLLCLLHDLVQLLQGPLPLLVVLLKLGVDGRTGQALLQHSTPRNNNNKHNMTIQHNK